MQFSGQTKLRAPAQQVWNMLTNPDSVSQCIPGLVSMEMIKPGEEYAMTVTAQLGSVQPTFQLTLLYTLVQPPNRARLRIRGKGPNTRLGASSLLSLHENGHGTTEMSWSFNLAAYGLVANIGERIVDHVFHDLTHQFISAVKERIEA